VKALSMPIWAALFAFAATCGARADLDDAGYKKAKLFYNIGSYEMARKGLEDYEKADKAFLDQNADIKKQIDDAIAYCLSHGFSSFAFNVVADIKRPLGEPATPEPSGPPEPAPPRLP